MKKPMEYYTNPYGDKRPLMDKIQKMAAKALFMDHLVNKERQRASAAYEAAYAMQDKVNSLMEEGYTRWIAPMVDHITEPRFTTIRFDRQHLGFTITTHEFRAAMLGGEVWRKRYADMISNQLAEAFSKKIVQVLEEALTHGSDI